MNQQEMDRRLSEIGGGDLVHTKIASKKTIKVTRDGALGPETSDAEVAVQRWTNERTGHVLEAYQKEDGTWEVVKDDPKGITPSKSAQESGPPGGKAFIDDGPEAGPHGKRWGWDPNAYGPGKGGYTRELGPSPSAQKPREAPKDEPNPNDPTRMRRWNPSLNGGQGGYEDAGPNAAEIERRRKEEEAKAERNKPPRTQPIKLEDGTYVQPIYDEKTGRVIRYEPVEGVPPDRKHKPLPAGVPRYTPDPDDPNDDYGLTAYDAALRAAQEAGLITYEQGRELMAAAGDVALVADKRSTTRQTHLSNQRTQDITQRQQDLSETASRRGDANTVYTNAYDKMVGSAQMLGPGGGSLAARAFRDALDLGHANAERWGGLQEYDRIPPAFEAVRKVKIGKDGTVNIEIPDPTPNTPLTPEDRSAQAAAAADGGQPTDATPGQSGQNVKEDRLTVRHPGAAMESQVTPDQWANDVTNRDEFDVVPIPPAFEAARQARPTFEPDRAALRAQGFDDETIDQALREGWAA